MEENIMAKLITGGMGYVGSELAHILVERGEEVVLFDITINRRRVEDIENRVKIVQGDLGNFSDVLNVVRDNHITEIYHLGSMVTYRSELNPSASFQANVIGSCNVLEAARLFGVKKMMFTSSQGTFNLDLPEGKPVTDLTIQRPLTVYGCAKLYIEGMGRVYRRRYGLDFRSIRYSCTVGPNIRGNPLIWAPALMEDAILGKPHQCVFAIPESRCSLIYIRDAARAADMVLQAPMENIKMVNYNVTGIPAVTTARELETILRKRFPNTKVTYGIDPTIQEGLRIGSATDKHVDEGYEKRASTTTVFDDSFARKEWGWKPQWTTPEAIIDIFEKDLKEHPQRFGMK